MFKRVLNTKGFWKSVFSLGLAFVLLFIIIKWAIEGFKMSFLSEKDPLLFIGGTAIAGFIYGFFVSFGKFRSKLKNKDLKP